MQVVSGTMKSDFVQSDTSDWTVNQMFKLFEKIEFGSQLQSEGGGTLGFSGSGGVRMYKEICRATLLVSVGASVGFEFERSKIKALREFSHKI